MAKQHDKQFKLDAVQYYQDHKDLGVRGCAENLEALSGGGYEAILEKQKLMKEIAECEELSLKNQLESRTVINEYDRVLSEVGEQLWHIQKDKST